MLQNGCKPDNFTYPFVTKAVGVVSWNVVREGKQIHGQIVGNGFVNNVFVVNTLISMYSVFQDMESARKLFDECLNLDIVSWNSLIDGYVKLGKLDMARIVFDKMPERNEVSWTAIISGYAKNGDLDVAQSLFDKMPICRNTVTWNSMISGFAKCGFVSMARKLFDEMPQRNIVSWNSMISAYAQSGELELARSLFNEMPERDVFSWSCMISGYAQCYRGEDALKLFKNMIYESGTKPNEVTLVSVLSACGHLTALDQGKWIHGYIRRNGMRLNDNLGAALIDMYAKCGCAETAFEVFLKLDHRNVSTWNALITGFAINGIARKALEAFVEMQRSETKPNSITFVGVLMACCHGGLVEEGRQHFGSMLKDYGIQPEMKHYGCMIDLLGRAGLLVEAEAIVKGMPMNPDVTVLGALLGACRIHGNIEMADKLRDDFLEMKSREAGCHILLSNIYAAASRWIDASDMRGILKVNEIKKEPGFSAV
ncbi:Pentatricopeptide repeat-containing protein [Thalictrum thalictroides]|uniref:Pentatricopeptide repeat-containing protein n=1 Tax=Thalictrum thalictroides TaxID=46969 RepID=A0A7J6VBH5_THATH|nr:Pentatricopeptide repeat-containing protein [Thalictrum thalictroides]